MGDVRYFRLDAQHAAELTENFVRLYAVVYAEPPYEEGPEMVDKFARSLTEEMNRPGFTLVDAMEGERVVGVAYGWTMPAGRWWSNAEDDPPEHLRDAPKFAVMEWMVHPDMRGRAVGRRLIVDLLSGRPEPWAVLASNPRAAARGMYARSGWSLCGRLNPSWGPPMDALALPLPLRQHES
ncbi:GNAT family N-acetyltransferase [Rhizomonospora bruguierae]|uniref:GNAT family N-acetyltransferase n=1 Tax=Rhizomonospora bruguierae TaxID=1581705 RepID=UPI0020BF4AE3|nr:GNAT family N-acetyltransferase [Micromonospora sp. NBRC 107566]